MFFSDVRKCPSARLSYLLLLSLAMEVPHLQSSVLYHDMLCVHSYLL
jgi:hypothetical protein